MNNVKLDDADRTLGVEQGYQPLSVRDGFIPTEEGLIPVVVTEWEPTPEEMDLVRTGKYRVEIMMLGTQHPPIHVSLVEEL